MPFSILRVGDIAEKLLRTITGWKLNREDVSDLGVADKPSFAGVTLTAASDLVSSAAAPTMVVNATDSDMYVGLKSGSTADQRAYLAFYDYAETNPALPDWLMGRNAVNDFILFDKENAIHRAYLNDGGSSYLSSGGSGAVVINGYAGEAGQGTGGFQVYSGGASPTIVFAISGASTTGVNSGSKSSTLRFFGGTQNDGAGVLVCGSEHATYPGKGFFRVGSTDILAFEDRGLCVGGYAYPSTGTRMVVVRSGTAPSTAASADTFIMYAADFAAGNAVPHFRTENGTIVKLNQDVSTTGAPEFAGLTVGGSAVLTSMVLPPTLWKQPTPGTIEPYNAGDDVALGTGELSAAAVKVGPLPATTREGRMSLWRTVGRGSGISRSGLCW